MERSVVEMFLTSGVMIAGNWEATESGSPQGGVVSPLIANVYLDAFDQEMKRRGHRIVRYADDMLILCRSEAGARHAQQVATNILEGDLKLTVNRDKTHRIHASQGVKFLGVEIGLVHTRIQAKKVAAFKAKVKAITRRTSPVNLEQVITDLNPVLRGWGSYFRMANCKVVYGKLAGWIRRRLRAKQLALWKKPGRLQRRLRQVGFRGERHRSSPRDAPRVGDSFRFGVAVAGRILQPTGGWRWLSAGADSIRRSTSVRAHPCRVSCNGRCDVLESKAQCAAVVHEFSDWILVLFIFSRSMVGAWQQHAVGGRGQWHDHRRPDPDAVGLSWPWSACWKRAPTNSAAIRDTPRATEGPGARGRAPVRNHCIRPAGWPIRLAQRGRPNWRFEA